MRIQPRQQILDIWRAASRASYKGGGWRWEGRVPANSVVDAEQLLCVMFPATQIESFRLENPNETDDTVLGALREFGGPADIPRLLVKTMTAYLKKYSRPDGTPIFSGGSNFVPDVSATEAPTPEQLGLDVVESYANSITLTLSALGFVKSFRQALTRDDLLRDAAELERLASTRLSAAMVGLLRSYSIAVFPVDSSEGRALLRTVNQSELPENRVIDELKHALRETAAGLREFNYGIKQSVELQEAGRLFECGWSWGITVGAPEIDFAPASIGVQREGYAEDWPYLYFTVVALDSIADLLGERTRLLGLLDDEQQRLATALQKRYDLTQRYWSTIAAYGTGARWPLEDFPWRTLDDAESDYFSLLVTSIAARQLAGRRDTDADLSRVGRVLVELANRARLTRRSYNDDPALKLHEPGVLMKLVGTESFGPRLGWLASDFAPLLLKRTIRVAALINDIGLRNELLEFADEVWDHVEKRRLVAVGSGSELWDQPAGAFVPYAELPVRYTQPSWHHTLRVVEGLVAAAHLTNSPPLRSDALVTFAADLLAEAENLHDREMLQGAREGGPVMRKQLDEIGLRLARSREIRELRPGSAVALLIQVLQDLENLAAARDSGKA